MGLPLFPADAAIIVHASFEEADSVGKCSVSSWQEPPRQQREVDEILQRPADCGRIGDAVVIGNVRVGEHAILPLGFQNGLHRALGGGVELALFHGIGGQPSGDKQRFRRMGRGV